MADRAGQIDEADQLRAFYAGLEPWPADQHWDADRLLIAHDLAVLAVLSDEVAVVGGKDHDGVVGFTGLLQLIEDVSHCDVD